MKAKRKPHCFVAMAFDHDDTDALYESAIAPVLRSNGVVPIIINRRQDNRDINQQIIEQLEACDFCIADLTYARQSVYFEAGYAQRAVEVIYTVRADHLLKGQPDDLRVHFDLQMKPIIKWSTPSDPKFPELLTKRLKNTVMRDWRLEQAKDEKLTLERDQFTHTSLSDRFNYLQKTMVLHMKKLGFTKWMILYPTPYGGIMDILPLAEFGHVSSTHPAIMSMNRSNQKLDVISLWVVECLTLKTLRDKFGPTFIRTLSPPHLDSKKMVAENCPIDNTVEHHIFVSIRDVPQARIMSALPSVKSQANCRIKAPEFCPGVFARELPVDF